MRLPLVNKLIHYAILSLIPCYLWANSPLEEFQKIVALSADFKQSNYDNDAILIEQSTGSIKLKRPDYLLWHTKKPDEQILSITPEAIWLYDVELEQVVKQDANRIKNSPLYWLINANKQQQPIFLEKVDNLYWYENTTNAQFKKVFLAFDNKVLKQLRLLSEQNTLVIEFDNIIYNPSSLSNQDFELEIPIGVDVIE